MESETETRDRDRAQRGEKEEERQRGGAGDCERDGQEAEEDKPTGWAGAVRWRGEGLGHWIPCLDVLWLPQIA